MNPVDIASVQAKLEVALALFTVLTVVVNAAASYGVVRFRLGSMEKQLSDIRAIFERVTTQESRMSLIEQRMGELDRHGSQELARYKQEREEIARRWEKWREGLSEELVGMRADIKWMRQLFERVRK